MTQEDDERIRNEIIAFVEQSIHRGGGTPIPQEQEDKWITWLENKCKQMSADNVKPKFKVGYWVVNKFGDVWHIDSFDKKNYQVSNGNEYNYFPISKQNEMHLWTIQDAKDGDVIVEDNISNHPSPFIAIFKTKGSEDDFSSHCFIGFDGYFYEGEVGHCSENIHPATKEQRELLFQKMKESSYEWDAEKKELKKIVDKEQIKKNLQDNSFRKDVFIEKTCEWLRDNYLKYPSEDCADTTKFVMDFKNYMNL